MATKAKSGKAAETKKKASPKKGEAPKITPKLSDFLGRKIKDIGHTKENSADELTIKFDNGYNVVIKGNYSFKIQEE